MTSLFGGKKIESGRTSVPEQKPTEPILMCPIDGQKLFSREEAENHADMLHAGTTIAFIPSVK